MNTPLWLHLARIGEECPQATEASFSALQRGKWERVAAHLDDDTGQEWVERMQGLQVLRAIKDLETGVPTGPEFKAQWLVKARSGLYKGTLEPSNSEMRQFCYEKRRQYEGLPPLSASGTSAPLTWFTPAPAPFAAKGVTWTDKLSPSGTSEMPFPARGLWDDVGSASEEEAKMICKPMLIPYTSDTLTTDQAYCDALLDESIRGAYKGRTGGKDYYEQGEAATGASSTIAAGSGSNPGVVASPSLPSWPKSYDSPDEGEFYDPTDVEPWRDAARREIERLQSIIAALERDLVEAKRESMLWHHRYTKETEVLPERERLERDLAEEREYGVATFRNWSSAKDTIASLEERLRKATAQMNTSAGTGDASVASTEDILGSPADVPYKSEGGDNHSSELTEREKSGGQSEAIVRNPLASPPSDPFNVPVAQLEEHRSSNPDSAGSIPAGDTIQSEGAASSNAPLGAYAPAVTSCVGGDTPFDPSTAWTEEQIMAMHRVYSICTLAPLREMSRDQERAVCCAIAKHASLFCGHVGIPSRDITKPVTPEEASREWSRGDVHRICLQTATVLRSQRTPTRQERDNLAMRLELVPRLNRDTKRTISAEEFEKACEAAFDSHEFKRPYKQPREDEIATHRVAIRAALSAIGIEVKP